MFSMITNIYNKKTKGPALMELFTATVSFFGGRGQLEVFDVCTTGDTAHYSSSYHTMLTRVWQQLEYRIDVCHVTRGAHIEHF